MKLILEKLQRQKHRDTTKLAYLGIWRNFNKFVIRLDHIPPTWEERTCLYIAYLAAEGNKSSTIKSYISGIKSILDDDGYVWNQNAFKFASLTRGCKLENDRVKTRLPIRLKLLELILDKIEIHYLRKRNQPYLNKLYKCLFVLAYYGLLRIGEMASGSHPFKAKDIHVSHRKQKILIVLFTSKTHGRDTLPQQIKIWADTDTASYKYCPFEVTNEFTRSRGGYRSNSEPFFVFQDGTPVKPRHVRAVLRAILKKLGLNQKLYNTHSFRIGRASDLMKSGMSVDYIKHVGRWKSNAVFKYIRD